jgi:hypothetical protein
MYVYPSSQKAMIVTLYSREPPPNTPQRFRNAERQRQRDAMLFASPELRHTPSSSASPHPAIEPLLFHSLPPPPASPPRVSAIVDVRHGEPLPPLPTHRHVTPDDPFALPIPAPVASQPQLVQVELNGRLLQLTQGIAG